jgi:hypothetical protein
MFEKFHSENNEIKKTEENLSTNESFNDVVNRYKEVMVVDEITEKFGIDKEEYIKIKNKLKKVWLKLEQLFLWYNKSISEKLWGLEPEVLSKIKKSIWIKFWLIKNVLNHENELDDGTIEKLWDHKKYRWEINHRIWNIFESINNKVIPSAEFLLKYNKTEDKNEFKRQAQWKLHYWSRLWPDKHINSHLNEIKEYFASKLNKKWEFDEWFWSTQDILWDWDRREQQILKNIWILKNKWIHMLEKADVEKEKKIIKKYHKLTLASIINSMPSDYYDVFTKWEDGTLKALRLSNMINKNSEYTMIQWKYAWFLWFIWLIWDSIPLAKWAKMLKLWKLVNINSKLEKLWMSSIEIQKFLLNDKQIKLVNDINNINHKKAANDSIFKAKNIIDFKKSTISLRDKKYKNFIDNPLSLKVAKQEKWTAYCWHRNVAALLEYFNKTLWINLPKKDIFSYLSIKTWLSPHKFIETFNKYSPKWLSIKYEHFSNSTDRMFNVIAKQLEKEIPVPMIYFPQWIWTPHYATIIWKWINDKWEKIYKIADSMEWTISNTILTKKELTDALKFDKKDLKWELVWKVSKLVLWWKNNIFIIEKSEDILKKAA